ncbi:hypothetical protein [Ureibacillus chungkukjangi]|uniref:Uncharacterized protein n=1 Tax=Ureibacillus chungkukjangi TaxID=1202712 RepID=A0A318TCP1_9BACL|nr:hypothetical protein [Ureibacillus chungkukjangi]MCM3389417.1 hypothetical protein [Ureibacillus chungkukjangi]PYF02484.1 hypothetical protein BJ095_14118 [Ureibacillus chungkukjangi]
MWNKKYITKLDLTEYLGINEEQLNIIISKMQQRVSVFAPSESSSNKLKKHEAATIEFVHIRMKEYTQDIACDLAVEVFYHRRITRVKNYEYIF